MTEEKYTIHISGELYKKIKGKIKTKESEFDSVDKFVERKLDELLNEGEQTLSKEDEEKVKERLKALGYMD